MHFIYPICLLSIGCVHFSHYTGIFMSKTTSFTISIIPPEEATLSSKCDSPCLSPRLFAQILSRGWHVPIFRVKPLVEPFVSFCFDSGLCSALLQAPSKVGSGTPVQFLWSWSWMFWQDNLTIQIVWTEHITWTEDSSSIKHCPSKDEVCPMPLVTVLSSNIRFCSNSSRKSFGQRDVFASARAACGWRVTLART